MMYLVCLETPERRTESVILMFGRHWRDKNCAEVFERQSVLSIFCKLDITEQTAMSSISSSTGH